MKATHVNWRALAAFVSFCEIILFATLEPRTAFAQQPMGILTEKDIAYKFTLINGLGPLSAVST